MPRRASRSSTRSPPACRSTRPRRSPRPTPTSSVGSQRNPVRATRTAGSPTRRRRRSATRMRSWPGVRRVSPWPRGWARSTLRCRRSCAPATGSSPRSRCTARPGRSSCEPLAGSGSGSISSTRLTSRPWRPRWPPPRPRSCTPRRSPTRRPSLPTTRPSQTSPIGMARRTSSTTRSPRPTSAGRWSLAQTSWSSPPPSSWAATATSSRVSSLGPRSASPSSSGSRSTPGRRSGRSRPSSSCAGSSLWRSGPSATRRPPRHWPAGSNVRRACVPSCIPGCPAIPSMPWPPASFGRALLAGCSRSRWRGAAEPAGLSSMRCACPN